MTLPPLPDLHPGAGYRAGGVREMLQAYGRQCAKDALLIQARDALAYTTDPDSPHYEDQLAAIAALTAAIDSPEPKGLFIDLIAQHEGLAEELRDLPEPYDQQALEPCPVCGWKAIVPGEPCLMCERNARMLAPEPEPVAWIGVHVFDALKAGKCVTSTMTKHKAFEDDVQIFTRPPAVREPLSEDQIFDIAHANEALFDRLAIEYQSRYVIALFRAIEAALRAKP